MESMRADGYDFYEGPVLNAAFKRAVKLVNAVGRGLTPDSDYNNSPFTIDVQDGQGEAFSSETPTSQSPCLFFAGSCVLKHSMLVRQLYSPSNDVHARNVREMQVSFDESSTGKCCSI
jgi:hypothetical protein